MGGEKRKLSEDFYVVVVGGGLAGMATAARLRALGARVTLIEKNSTLGGKVAEHRAMGFRWDIGPSLLTMPDVLADLADALGSIPPPLYQLNTICRYFWPDGHQLDINEDFYQHPEVADFLQYSKGIYELSGEAFLRHPPSEFWRAFTLKNLPKLKHLPKLTTFKTLSEEVRKRFTDPYLIQIFERYATYNGSNPHQTPATFNVIPYVENTFGAWYPDGGIRSIAEWLTTRLEDLGVEIVTDTIVTHYDGTTLQANEGRPWQPDVVICNGEVQTAHERWIRIGEYREERNHLYEGGLSLSGYILLLGVAHKYKHLRHHNIFFSSDYDQEFKELFDTGTFPSDPTIYLNISSCSSPDDAPPGHDNYFILVNAPATEVIDWNLRSPELNRRIIQKLEALGLPGLQDFIVYSHTITPGDLANRDFTTMGALYGTASHGIKPSLFRPPIQSRLSPNLYFCGGSTHPGGGIPLVLLSAKMVAEKIVRQHGKPV